MRYAPPRANPRGSGKPRAGRIRDFLAGSWGIKVWRIQPVLKRLVHPLQHFRLHSLRVGELFAPAHYFELLQNIEMIDVPARFIKLNAHDILVTITRPTQTRHSDPGTD